MLRIVFIIFLVMWSLGSLASAIQEYRLPNGLKVIVAEDHRAKVVFSSIWYRVGSANEYEGITGLSHLLEHLMFTGTHKFTETQISKLISGSGGDQNAMTTYDYTSFFQELTPDKLPLSFEIAADSMKNLVLRDEAFKREQKIVMEERRMRVDDVPEMLTYERFNAAAYINSPYHNPVAGWMTDIEHLSLDDVRKWYQTWYGPNNATLVIVGDVNPNQVYQLAQQYFGSIKPIVLPEIKPRTQVASLGARNISINVPAKLPILFLGYNVPVLSTAQSKEQAYALYVLSSLLAGNNSSRLNKNLIRGTHIAASVNSDYQLYQRYNYVFLLYGNPAGGTSVEELKNAFLAEIKNIQNQSPSGEELERIKTQIISNYLYQKDSLMARAINIGSAEMSGNSWRDDENFVNQIQKVTPLQVQQAAQLFLTPRNMITGVLNPLVENTPVNK